MKKSISLFLVLSILMMAFPIQSGEFGWISGGSRPRGDFDFERAAAGMAAIGVVGIGVVIAGLTAAGYTVARYQAKKEGVSFGLWWIAKCYGVSLNEQNKHILLLAQQRKKDELKQEIIKLNEEFFGREWERPRTHLIEDMYGMSPSLFIARYSKEKRVQMFKYLSMYLAIAVLYFYRGLSLFMDCSIFYPGMVTEMDKAMGFKSISIKR